jgi:hypothetical protein
MRASQGRVCTGCFDHVVDAEAALAGQGLVCLARAAARRRGRANRGARRHGMSLGVHWALWGSGVARPLEGRKEGLLSPEHRARHELFFYALLIQRF